MYILTYRVCFGGIRLKILSAKDYSEMSSIAAEIIANIVKEKPDAVLGLATGNTPIGMYKKLIEMYKAGEVDFSKVKTVNLDEYVGLGADDQNSYRAYMNKNLFSGINIDINNTNVPNGLAADIEAECKRYEDVIKRLGSQDIQVLGIGVNGHIGFNEPSITFNKGTHVVELTDSTIGVNSKIFKNLAAGAKAITMGIKNIMNAKQILLIADGDSKKDILRKALYGEITPNVPASVLQLHPNVTVVEACGLGIK